MESSGNVTKFCFLFFSYMQVDPTTAESPRPGTRGSDSTLVPVQAGLAADENMLPASEGSPKSRKSVGAKGKPHEFKEADPKGDLNVVRPLAPSQRGQPWPKTPCERDKAPPPRDSGVDKYNDIDTHTLEKDVSQSPRRYATSFSSELLRLSQMRRACRSELSTPVPWKIETEEVGPGTYFKGSVEGERKQSSFFRSASPPASPSLIFADTTKTTKFIRSRASIIGPGFYEPPPGSFKLPLRPKRSSAFASSRPQRPGVARLLSADLDLPDARSSFTSREKVFSFSRRDRKTLTPIPRDPGQDHYNDTSTRSIGWSISNGSGLCVG